jgi:pyruvate/2-oxoglutarate dehydrogenase complex dihydrolipoamide acyltransferase (E2) component
VKKREAEAERGTREERETSMFGRRTDATAVRDLNLMRRFMPFLSPRRGDSLFYMLDDIEVDAAMDFLEERNRERPEDRPLTLFHLFIRALSQAMALRPGINRFVKGRRLWQRDGVYLTFTAKRALVDGAPLITIKRRFHPESESLEEMADAIYDQLTAGRAGRRTTSDSELGAIMKLPGFAIRLTMGAARIIDEMGLLPRRMIDADPLFTSAFVTNLGSIGFGAGFHHLWEYGTASIFGVLGRIDRRPDGKRFVQMGWTYDERIEDGLYAYISLEGIRKRLEQPELLEKTTAELAERG